MLINMHVDIEWGSCWIVIGNSTDTLELATDCIEYEVPEPHMMSENTYFVNVVDTTLGCL